MCLRTAFATSFVVVDFLFLGMVTNGYPCMDWLII